MEEKKEHFSESGFSTQINPEIKSKTKLQPDDWLCLLCYKKIASDKDRFLFDGKSDFQFTNPSGYRFEIITFGKADGCRIIGKPTLDFTWFKNHSWSFAICGRCGLHLGWKYSGECSFFGLIKTRLIKGITLFN